MNPALTENWQTIPDYLKELSTLACALFDDNGRLIDANRAFFQLVRLTPVRLDPWQAAHCLSNPAFAQLRDAAVSGNLVYQGILNIGPRDGTAHSLHGTVHRHGQRLWLVAEPDMAELAQLNENVLQLNNEMAEMGRELQRRNNLLKRNEVVIQAQMDDLRQVNSQLEQAQTQLLQAEKMATIGQLAAGVAHEINNPIGFIQANFGTLENYTQDLFSTLALYEKSEHRLSESELATLAAAKQQLDLPFLKSDVPHLLLETPQGIQRIKAIVQQLKDFANLDGGEGWQWASLQRCLDSTLKIAASTLAEKVEIITEYGELPEIECLPAHLNQVFLNLLLNASQSMETRGSITVRAGVDGDQAWIEIRDNGRGIAAEQLSRIFDPFYTTRPPGQGYGLGLSLSYSIVKKHHGHIAVASSPGLGSTFRITLPLRQTPPHETNNP